MDQPDPFSLLSRVQSVDVPGGLKTRIDARIAEMSVPMPLAPSWTWVAAAAFAILVAVNLWLIQPQSVAVSQVADPSLGAAMSEIGVQTSYQLYDD
ncbi:MAG: hypothetical protein AAFV07_05965 [Bacteroidota bacterium]